MRKIRWPALGDVLGLRGRKAEPPSRVIVGLGNPGSQYARTRHNVGFWCIDRLAVSHGISFSRRNRSALVGEGTIEGHRVVLAKPRTFVNRSGQAITYLLARFKVSTEDLLVIYDDIALPLGKIRLRPGGSAGTHNGLQSVIEAAGTNQVPRLRVGIGQPTEGGDQIEYVLGVMSEQEQNTADEAVDRAVQAVVSVLNDGVTEAMNRFN